MMRSLTWGILSLLLGVSACNGVIGEPGAGPGGGGGGGGGGGDGGVSPSGLCLEVGEQPLLRLSSAQWENTVRDLFPGTLGADLVDMHRFPATVIHEGFRNDAIANTVNTAESNAIEDNAELLAEYLLENATQFVPETMPCVDGAYTDADIDGCADRFIDELGLRVYRRPLEDGERAIVRGLYDEIRGLQGAEEGWSAIIQFYLESPALLYRTERGQGSPADAPDLNQLSHYEMASRLSYLFWNTMPDDELFAAAAASELGTAEEVANQAMRLLDDPRSDAVLHDFHTEWLRLYELEGSPKDRDVYPAWNGALEAALLAETPAVVDHVLGAGSGTYAELISGNAFPVAAPLAEIYGLPSADGSPVEVPDRHGLLTLASFAATHAREASTNPIERGAFFRHEILCAFVPTFPGNLDTTGPLESSASLPTARQRLAPLLERDDCAGCHTGFNPIGMALEQYDAIGAFRATENDATIDPSGEITIGDVDGAFAGPEELMAMVAASDTAHDCYATQWFRFAHGRGEAPEDSCALGQLREAFAQSGGDIRSLVLALTQTEAFRYRRTVLDGGAP